MSVLSELKKANQQIKDETVKKRERRAKRYGLTVDQLNVLEAMRNGCHICGRKPLSGKRLYIDHDHKTGRVRGMLCFTCNYRLLGKGPLNDPARHEAAAVYLRSGFDARNL